MTRNPDFKGTPLLNVEYRVKKTWFLKNPARWVLLGFYISMCSVRC